MSDDPDILIEPIGDGVIVRPRGTIDHTNAAVLGVELAPVQTQDVSRLVDDSRSRARRTRPS